MLDGALQAGHLSRQAVPVSATSAFPAFSLPLSAHPHGLRVQWRHTVAAQRQMLLSKHSGHRF